MSAGIATVYLLGLIPAYALGLLICNQPRNGSYLIDDRDGDHSPALIALAWPLILAAIAIVVVGHVVITLKYRDEA